MEISKNISNDTTVLALKGRLDTNSSPQLQTAIAELGTPAHLTLDFTQLEYISSSGLRVLLAAQKALPGRLTLSHVCPEVMEIFDITGFTDILTIE